MAKYTLTNSQPGGRGHSFVELNSGETREVELTEDQVAEIELYGVLDIGKKPAKVVEPK